MLHSREPSSDTTTRSAREIMRNQRWVEADEPRLLRWSDPEPSDATLRACRGLTVAIVDGSFTADVAEAVAGPLTLRRFAAVPAVQSGPLAEHGTAIACLMAGSRPPFGWVPGARVLCAMVGSPGSSGYEEDVAASIRWLVGEVPDVVVIPMGTEQESPLVAAALELLAACDPAPLVFASLGNIHPHRGLFPARMRGVVSVAAADDTGALLPDAAREPCPDIIAPGYRLQVRTGVTRIAEADGSSVACAVAAGCALLRMATHIEAPRSKLIDGLRSPL